MKTLIGKTHIIEDFVLKTIDGKKICDNVQSYDPKSNSAIDIWGEEFKPSKDANREAPKAKK